MRSLSPIQTAGLREEGMILPRLENIGTNLPPDYLHKHFVADLYIYYVFEQESNYRYLRHNDLENGIAFEEMHITSINNLLAFIGDRIELNGDSDDAMMITVDGEHESSLLLFDKFWNELEIRLDASLLVFTPSHDLLFLAKENSVSGRERLTDIRNQFLSENIKGILGSMFLKRNSGIWTLAE